MFLFLTGIFVFSFAALLDPFLNLWDERFHALVAKNLLSHPLKPTLYDSLILDIPYDRWDKFHIWLHKQPLFLWQIALSFKFFGVSEFSLRLPSVLLGAVFVIAGYRIGCLLVNENVGFLLATLIITSVYFMELISGRQGIDHNDLSFMVYVSLSILCFIEYILTGKKYFIYLIGLFSGMAILCKWLVGLLVYFGWLAYIGQKRKWNIRSNIDFILALVVTSLVFLPWQIFTFIKYPNEAIATYQYNAEHLFIPIEGHSGSFFYHFSLFDTIYGKYSIFLLIPAFYVLFKRSNDKKIFWSLTSMVVFVYLFFSVAATKMPSFTIIVSVIILLAFAILLETIFFFLLRENKLIFKWLGVLLMVGIFVFRYNIKAFWNSHNVNQKNSYSNILFQNKRIFEALNLPANTVLFNVKGRHYIEAMFYTNNIAYNFIPSIEQIKLLTEKQKEFAIFKYPNETLPTYIMQNSNGSVLDETLLILDSE